MEQRIRSTDDNGENIYKLPLSEVYQKLENRRTFSTMDYTEGANFSPIDEGHWHKSNTCASDNCYPDEKRQCSLPHSTIPRFAPRPKMTAADFPSAVKQESAIKKSTVKLQKPVNGPVVTDDYADATSKYYPNSLYLTESFTANRRFNQHKPDPLIHKPLNPYIGKQATMPESNDELPVRSEKSGYEYFRDSFIDQYDVKKRKQMLSKSLFHNWPDRVQMANIKMSLERNRAPLYPKSIENICDRIHNRVKNRFESANEASIPYDAEFDFVTKDSYFHMNKHHQDHSSSARHKHMEVKYKNEEFNQNETHKNFFDPDKTYPESGIERSSASDSNSSNVQESGSDKIYLIEGMEACPANISAPSGRSKASIISRKQLNDMLDLEMSKCNAISVIDDSLHRIHNSRNETHKSMKSEKSTLSLNEQAKTIEVKPQNPDRSTKTLQPDLLNNIFKEYRGYHLENMKQEIKRIQYLDSLPEKWEKEMFSSVV